jgi:hypothetical protein
VAGAVTHLEHHPDRVEGCFGCKVLGLGYDGGHRERRTVVSNEINGRPAGHHVEHRDGRQDAVVRPDALRVTVSRKDTE